MRIYIKVKHFLAQCHEMKCLQHTEQQLPAPLLTHSSLNKKSTESEIVHVDPLKDERCGVQVREVRN